MRDKLSNQCRQLLLETYNSNRIKFRCQGQKSRSNLHTYHFRAVMATAPKNLNYWLCGDAFWSTMGFLRGPDLCERWASSHDLTSTVNMELVGKAIYVNSAAVGSSPI